MGNRDKLTRRETVRRAVAVGGAVGLSACLEAEPSGESRTSTSDTMSPQGPTDLSALPQRQHAWNDYLVTNRTGNTLNPQHQVLLFLNYPHDDIQEGDRTTVEHALRTTERAFQRGTGDNDSAVLNRGLLFTLGYSPTYFERVSDGVPDGIDLPKPDTVLSDLDTDTSLADDYDAVLLLASDLGSVVLSAEEALFGSLPTVNGVSVDDRFSDVFDVAERRSGFIGRGLPAERLKRDDVSPGSPLSMGFRSNYSDTKPSEEKTTIQSGPFAGGTTQMVSRMRLDLDAWYEKDEGERVQRMFTPSYTPDEVGEAGAELGPTSGVGDTVDNMEEDAKQHGCLGHGQKTAAARDSDGDPLILRRSESISTDSGGPWFNFVSVQREMAAFVKTRRAMDGHNFDDVVDDEDHGIRSYIELTNRGTYLLPPRDKRALPTSG